MLDYMAQRGSQNGSFLYVENGSPLTRGRFVARIHEAQEAPEMDPAKYAGHSFHIGAATTAAMCRHQDSLIKTLVRWESAVVYTLYAQSSKETPTAVPSNSQLDDATNTEFSPGQNTKANLQNCQCLIYLFSLY